MTEAIGTLYGDSDDDSGHEPRHDSRPLSFVASPFGGEQIQKLHMSQLHPRPPLSLAPEEPLRLDERRKVSRTMSDMVSLADSSTLNGNSALNKPPTLPTRKAVEKANVPYDSYPPLRQPASPLSPTLSLRDVQSDSQAASQFPITNIDNPNDIAQELSNLQALRRMSMDVVNTADPDLIPFQGLSLMAMPSIAPSGEDDEGDISRLLWVPAKVHPELAPDQFKSFLEKRVQSIKRRSGESLLAVDSHQRANADGLRRKKSMLSRQVDGELGDRDDPGENAAGDWHLQRKASQTSTTNSAPELSLNDLVKDPSRVVQRLTLDSQKQVDGQERTSLDDDKPILLVPTMGLRRSTRTTYRKGGSLRSGDRLPFSKRVAAARQAQREGDSRDGEETSGSPLSVEQDAPTGHALLRTFSEPLTPENFSRPARPVMTRLQFNSRDEKEDVASPPEGRGAHASEASAKRPLRGKASAPHEYATNSPSPHGASSMATEVVPTPPPQSHAFPQRSSSQSGSHPDLAVAGPSSELKQTVPDESFQQHQQHQPLQAPLQPLAPQLPASQLQQSQQPQQLQQLQQSKQPPPPRSSKRPSLGRSPQQPASSPAVSSGELISSQTLTDMVQNPSALPGSGYTRTDSLTFIPTLPAEDRKGDRKAREKDEAEGGRSTGWKWFKSDEKDKKKRDKEKERDKDDQAKKLRAKNDRTQPENGHDGARLDVLQISIDSSGPKGRESLLLDRESAEGRLYDDRKKDSNSRKSNDTRKEKDNFFGLIFGGSRRKDGKDGGGGKGKQRITSPEPPLQLQRPDIDYPYTRFPIVEERAIYRMAHIKLANPRRDLRSQVLLSNFMYSYLAKVQAMHPQLNVPTSPHQKRQEEEQKRRQQELQQQQYLEQQMLAQQQQQQPQGNIDQYSFDYHRVRGLSFGALVFFSLV